MSKFSSPFMVKSPFYQTNDEKIPPRPQSKDYMDPKRLVESGKKYAAAVAKWEAKYGKKVSSDKKQKYVKT